MAKQKEPATHLWALVEEWKRLSPYPANQRQLAKLVGVSRQTVTDWKLGYNRPTPDNLDRLSDVMRPILGDGIHDQLLRATAKDYEPGATMKRRRAG